MRIPRGLTIALSLIVLAGLLAAGYFLIVPRGSSIVSADFGLNTITPNADGDDDVTLVSYQLRREAVVSIYLEGADGQRYFFREDEIRPRGEYGVFFGGVVDGFTLPGEDIKGEVLDRLIPDGDYTWVLQAVSEAAGRADEVRGSLSIVDGDAQLPDLWEFSISPTVFTPNQDGLDDRVYINVYVPKEAELVVYLEDETGDTYYVPQFQQDRAPGEEGRHIFEWDGGVELGKDPPPNGDYTLNVEALDAEGQRVRRTGTLQVTDGGVPFAEIVAQPVGDTVRFSGETVIQGDILTFEVTVWNYGEAPIRTTGPEPGFVYEQNEYFASSGFYQESGAWRIGLHCDTCVNDYPWRWSVGSYDELTAVEVDGQTQYYLMPGQRVVVHGGVRLTDIIEARNPQEFWVGLIHEDVGISEVNNRVDPHWIEIVPAAPSDEG